MPILQVSNQRLTGLIYLIVIITGMISLAYVPSLLYVSNDDAATVNNIVEHEKLFRFGIASSMVCYLAFLLLPLAFHRFLSAYHAYAADLMLIFALISVPLSLGNLAHKLDILTIVETARTSTNMVITDRVAAIMPLLDQYRSGLLISKIFWGLWLLPLGYLLIKSGSVPKLVAILLILGGLGYVVDVLASVLSIDYATSAIRGYITLPASIGEMATCIYLLVMKTKS